MQEHKTTARILDILECVAGQSDGISFSDISRATDIPKGSIFPLLHTLCQRGYLSFNEREQRYYPGETLFVIGNKYTSQRDILSDIQTVIKSLSAITGETIYLTVLSGRSVMFLLKSESRTNIRVVSDPGRKLPAYSTANGKALLSQFSPEQIRQMFPPDLMPITANTITDRDKLMAQLEMVAQSGFAYENSESTDHIRCIATPVYVDGQCLAAISVAIPVFRYNKPLESKVKEEIIKARTEIERIISMKRSQWIYS